MTYKDDDVTYKDDDVTCKDTTIDKSTYMRGFLKEYQYTTLSSKRTHSIAREHILWWLLKEYQYTTHTLS